jgi:hypothetical protein
LFLKNSLSEISFLKTWLFSAQKVTAVHSFGRYCFGEVLAVRGGRCIGQGSCQVPPSKCHTFRETPGGRLRTGGDSVIEAAAKRSIVPGLKPLTSPVCRNFI